MILKRYPASRATRLWWAVFILGTPVTVFLVAAFAGWVAR